MSARPFKKISVGRSRKNGDLLVWINAFSNTKKNHDLRYSAFDGIHTTHLHQHICLPKRVWYYRVFTLNKPGPAFRVRVERVSMKQEDDLLPWSEAFEVWCTYARML